MIAWMLYASMMSLLITGAAHGCAGICALYRIPTRWCWAAALLCSMAAPLIARSVPARVEDNALRFTAVTYSVIETVSDPPQPAVHTARSASPITPGAGAAVVWVIASVTLLLTLAAAHVRLRRVRRTWRRDTVCGERVLISDDTGPAVIGLRRHEIVLPEWALKLDGTALALAVTHEREHVAAGDPWMITAALFAVALAPWNPALWLQLRQLRRSVEGDCDRRVLRRTHDAHRYATLLINVGQRRRHARAPLLALSYPASTLEWRIRAMTSRTPSHRPARAIISTVFAAALGAAAIALPRPGLSQDYRTPSAHRAYQARAIVDTGAPAHSDSMALAATRDTLARLRSQMHREPGVMYHVTVRNGRTSATALPRARAHVSVAMAQAAVASHFPDAATAVTSGRQHTFAFLVRPDGGIERASVDSANARNLGPLALNTERVASIDVLKKVPVGQDTATVIWVIRK